MATYFDKSFFPYNPQSDISVYGKAFHNKQPKLPKDLADRYYTRSWQHTGTYGDFKHTRLFLGMLNKFFDRSNDEAQYFKSLSTTEKYIERNKLEARDAAYYWSSHQTTANKLGLLDESLNPSVYRGDLNNDGSIDTHDAHYGVGQLIWSLLGRPGVDGMYANQIHRASMGNLLAQFSEGSISDPIVQDLLASIGPNTQAHAAVTNLLTITEAESMAHAQSMANGENDGFSDAELYGLAVLLSTSQHLFLQGRRNLFGWANQSFDQWGTNEQDATTTRHTILSTFRPEDQSVFSNQLVGAIDTDPLGAMIHDLSIQVGSNSTLYRQHAVVRGTDGNVRTWVFQSPESDNQWIGVSQTGDSLDWQYGVYENSIWVAGDTLSDTELPSRQRSSVDRRIQAWSPMQSWIQRIMEGAVRYLNQTGDSTMTASDFYSQSQASIQALSTGDQPVDAQGSYQQWVTAFPVATLYRAVQLSEQSGPIAGGDFNNYQSLYTIESAGWQTEDTGIFNLNGSQIFSDQGYFYRSETHTEQFKSDRQLFLNSRIAQSRANATYNERRRDQQAIKAAKWVRSYKSWRESQDGLLL